MKNVLVVYYSQSGQLRRIAQTIASSLQSNDDINLHFYQIEMEQPFPFPWSKETFFGVFPETFLQIAAPIKPIPEDILNTKFDLILLNYQVWYLSPSIPINSFLKSDQAKTLFHNTPVVTINGSRNMWIMAQEKVKVLLQNCGAKLKGNIALVDRAGNLISVVTIVEWMMSGVKERYLGIFPLPGVSDYDINQSKRFGVLINDALKTDTLDTLQQNLVAADAVKVSSYLALIDKTANRIFSKWANFIITKGESRSAWLKGFYIYLLLAIWVASPIVYILHIISYPFRWSSIKKLNNYYKGV